MSVIRPWVGEHYWQGDLGARLLLLGESNYDKSDKRADDYSNIICENVQDCVFKGSARFFTKVAKTVAMATGATSVSRDDVRDVWRHLAFTNFIQAVLRSDREPPSQADWETGKAALTNELLKLQPEIIVVMGVRLASHVEWLPLVAPNTAVAVIAHPSSFGFSYRKWIPVVRGAFVAGDGLTR